MRINPSNHIARRIQKEELNNLVTSIETLEQLGLSQDYTDWLNENKDEEDSLTLTQISAEESEDGEYKWVRLAFKDVSVGTRRDIERTEVVEINDEKYRFYVKKM